MDIIHLLPDSVANQIAAGEVVQRPSSVIKELMENAIDAGALNVDVLVEDAGRTSIQVIDDGKGMSPTDARMAFERHATSKIHKAEDLFTLSTMGFRGEALPSIASVSQVRLQTRTAMQEIGSSLSIDGSQVISQEACACPVGTNFEVRNLFFNVPARRKFLKSNQTELNAITQEFERVALVNPSVSFSLSHNGHLLTQLPSSSLRQRIVTLFGKKLNEQLLPVEVETSLATVSGFVGKPDSSKKKGAHQYLFVNGRYMRHAYFHKAVMEAYAHLIPEGEQIPYFLYFQVDPSQIDVNIHPTKTEIKFENDTAIWQILVAAVRDALGRFCAVPTIEFDVEGRPEIPVYDAHAPRNVQAPKLNVDTSYNPFKKKPDSSAPTNWEDLYPSATLPEVKQEDLDDEEEVPSLFSATENNAMEMSSEHFQFKGQYILTAVRSGLMMVDQHRAHIRILYDRYCQQMQNATASTQGLLFPEMVQFAPSDAHVFSEMDAELRALGFDIEPLGGGAFSINGVPSSLDGANPCDLLERIVDEAKLHDGQTPSAIQHTLALTMARSTSIVVGQVLSVSEMDALLNDLFSCQNPNYTPTGKPVLTILTNENIEGFFKS